MKKEGRLEGLRRKDSKGRITKEGYERRIITEGL